MVLLYVYLYVKRLYELYIKLFEKQPQRNLYYSEQVATLSGYHLFVIIVCFTDAIATN